jgi:photosystem II stability/assembly factor-like uncharacterized protein
MKNIDKITNLLFYAGVILFFLGFNFSDNPPTGWYLQTMPDLNGRSISDIFFLDSLTGYAVARQTSDSSYILKTSNGGDNWSIVYRSFLAMEKIQFLNTSTGYSVGAYLFKTTSGGFNWFQVNAPSISPENLYVLNEDTIWIISSEPLTGGVFRTTNGGQSWVQQLSAGNQNPGRIYMFNARIGFICKVSTLTNLRKTTDGGNTWITVLPNEGFFDIKFIDSLTGWKAQDFFKKTTDGGITWFDQPYPQGNFGVTLFPSIRNFSLLNRDTIWGGYGVAAYPNLNSRGILLRSTNGGSNWNYQIPDTSFQIVRYPYVKFLNNKIGWAYGFYNGIHTTTGGDTTFYTDVEKIGTEVPSGFVLHQNYPNPFNPKTTIEYEIKQTCEVKLYVYDIRGKEVTYLVNRKLSPGKYKTDFPGVLYSSGVYFYMLAIDGKPADTKKMILIK